ncbi:MAG: radical SAM protein [Candidatus Omnitrophica bacterium]|nr:radical SAM protein [Candidatus Omnitrophota bacterium]
MKNLGTREFSRELQQRTGIRRKPLNGQWELSFGCNLRCVHCYNSCYNNPESIKNELKFKEITNILDQIHNEGCLWLCFTGGEPLMRPDFLDIYAYAKKLGLLLTIFTNGTLITEEIADYFLKEPPFSIEISLNGITRVTYEKITQVKGSFENCLRGIKLIKERKLPLKLKAALNTLNYSELEKMKAFASNLGISFRHSSIIYPAINHSKNPLKFRLSAQAVANLQNSKEDLDCEEEKTEVHKNKPLPKSDFLFHCSMTMNTFHINPYGELFFCNWLRKPSFSLREGNFKEGFDTLYPQIRSLRYKTDSKCRDCDLYNQCYQCPARAYIENKDMEKPVDYFCEITHRQKEKGIRR